MPKFHHPGAELAATRHVLESPTIRRPQHTRLVEQYFDAERGLFDWERLLGVIDWTADERAVIGAAVGVWNGSPAGSCSVGELVAHLEDDDLRRVIEALALRRGLLLVS